METRCYAALGVIACLASANCHNARPEPERPEPVVRPKIPESIGTSPRGCLPPRPLDVRDIERDRAREPVHAKTRADLDAAVRAKDVDGVLRLLSDPVLNRGIWFPDATCEKRFGTPSRVAGADLPAFARCLVQLELQATPRELSLAIDLSQREPPIEYGHAIFAYQPGIEIEVELDGDHVRGLGYLYESEPDRGRPTLTVEAFEALRTSGSPDRSGGELGWVKVCLDKSGTVDRFVTLDHQYSETNLELLAQTWAFRPFARHGRAVPACAVLDHSDAATTAGKRSEAAPVGRRFLPNPELARLPAPRVKPVPPRTPDVPQNVVEDLRIAGTTRIRPDLSTRSEIQHTGKEIVQSSHKVCLDATGAVTTVATLASSGFSNYDALIARQMRRWRFLPYRVRGKPVPVCTAFEIEFRFR